MKQSFVIHYHEINLKRGNRGWFEERLQQHAESLLRSLPHAGIRRYGGRMMVSLLPESPTEEIERRLRCIPGIANFSLASEITTDLEEMRKALVELTADLRFQSFKIDARRGTKDFPLTSQQINEELGRFVQTRSGAAVRLDNPELTCSIEIVGRRTFVSLSRIPGLGGLPARTGGRAACLISGGIDSPVAAFRMMRRGCSMFFLHFHSYPQTTMESVDKVRKILGILSRYQFESSLYLVPFADVQRQIVAFTPSPLRVLLYRRFMIRVAEAVAAKIGASALVTGDSLGQVASQTLENLRAVSAAVGIPILRPLVGDDKEDIIRSARAIGTYELSILPDQDCCTMFVPRHPETTASAEQLSDAEASLEVPRLVEATLAAAVQETIGADFSPPADAARGAAVPGRRARKEQP